MRLFITLSLLALCSLLVCDDRAVQDDNQKADKSYGQDLGSIGLTPNASIQYEHNIAPWLANYEGKTIVERQTHRHNILNQVCNSMEHPMLKTFPPNILVDDQNKLVFCFIEKVGSSTLLQTVIEANRLTLGLPKAESNEHDFLLLERYGINRLNTYPKQEQEDILRTHFKFLFVRHPLSRLRSAHGMLTRAVTSEPIYHVIEGLLNGTDWKVKGFPEFDTFVHLISSEWKTLKETQNNHWNNFQDMCIPCYINYDFIGKHEYFAEELNYVVENKLQNAQPIMPKSTITQWKELDQVYQNLSKETLDLFLQRYGNDFRLFNYKY